MKIRPQKLAMILLALLFTAVAAHSFEIGKILLVKWSADNYWYPATIVQVDGTRYYVKFQDGDEDWTTADFIRDDDVKKGDRVFGNYKNQGKYYPGKITSRNGQAIHIKYDDGDEENTTISFIRVMR